MRSCFGVFIFLSFFCWTSRRPGPYDVNEGIKSSFIFSLMRCLDDGVVACVVGWVGVHGQVAVAVAVHGPEGWSGMWAFGRHCHGQCVCNRAAATSCFGFLAPLRHHSSGPRVRWQWTPPWELGHPWERLGHRGPKHAHGHDEAVSSDTSARLEAQQAQQAAREWPWHWGCELRDRTW